MIKRKNKGQEEMVGFILIIVLVMIILLVFLGFALRKGGVKVVESFEVDSFIESYKQYTSECAIGAEYDYRTLNQLISDCSKNKNCYDGRRVCDVLEKDSEEILEKSWNLDERGDLKGYTLTITEDTELILNITQGNISRNYKGPSRGIDESLDIELRVYEN